MKALRRVIDRTLGNWTRHFFFVCVRSYYGLFYNISCSDKAVLQDIEGGLILSTHVSRHDGPMLAALLYPTRRVRPAVRFDEYYSWLQWFPMVVAGAIPMSSPKSWPQERRAAQKTRALGIVQKVIENGKIVLLFPAGRVKRQREEIIEPHFSGAYETLKTLGDIPVILIRIRGLSPYDEHKHDFFWSFIGRDKGRRHVSVSIERIEGGLDTSQSLEAFNADLERRLNGA